MNSITPYLLVCRCIHAFDKISTTSTKYWFELDCCITDGTADMKETFKFNSIKYTDTSAILYDNKGKKVIELTPDNCHWIGNLYVVDKYINVILESFQFDKLEKGVF